MAKRHPYFQMLRFGVTLLTLVTSLLVTTYTLSVTHAATHIPLPEYKIYPVSTVGRLIVHFISVFNVCSGTVLTSANESVVDTAAHCFYSPTGQMAQPFKMEFCPQFHNGVSPYGCWAGKQVFISSAYKWKAASKVTLDAVNDYGFLVVSPLHGKTIGKAVQGIPSLETSKVDKLSVTAYGYPAKPPHTGNEIYSFAGQASLTAGGLVRELPNFDLGEGASGGPWFYVNPNNATTYFVGHSVQGSSSPQIEYSPALNVTWFNLFRQASQVQVQ